MSCVSLYLTIFSLFVERGSLNSFYFCVTVPVQGNGMFYENKRDIILTLNWCT